jgi:hypothetical protein
LFLIFMRLKTLCVSWFCVFLGYVSFLALSDASWLC